MNSKNSVLDTLHINLWGIPGSGKFDVATELHSVLSRMGISTEIVQEYAKELGWAGDLARFDANGDMIEVDQFVISAEQYRRENLVHGIALVAITDAPVLAGVLYASEEDEQGFKSLLRRRTSGWRNLDVLLSRAVEHGYGSRGRIQSRDEALAMMPRLEYLLMEERPNFARLSAENAVSLIVPMVIKRLKSSSVPILF